MTKILQFKFKSQSEKIKAGFLIFAITAVVIFGIIYIISLGATEEKTAPQVTPQATIKPPFEVADWTSKLPGIGTDPILAMNDVTAQSRNVLIGAGNGKLYLLNEVGSKDNVNVQNLTTKLNFGANPINVIAGSSNTSSASKGEFNLVGGNNGKLALVYVPYYNPDTNLVFISDKTGGINLINYNIKSIKTLKTSDSCQTGWLIMAENVTSTKLIYARSAETACAPLIPNMTIQSTDITTQLTFGTDKITAIGTAQLASNMYGLVAGTNNKFNILKLNLADYPTLTVFNNSFAGGQPVIDKVITQIGDIEYTGSWGSLGIIGTADGKLFSYYFYAYGNSPSFSVNDYYFQNFNSNTQPITFATIFNSGALNPDLRNSLAATNQGKVILAKFNRCKSHEADSCNIEITGELNLLGNYITSAQIMNFGTANSDNFTDSYWLIASKGPKLLRVYNPLPQISNITAKRSYPYLNFTISGNNLSSNSDAWFKTDTTTYLPEYYNPCSASDSHNMTCKLTFNIPQTAGELFIEDPWFAKQTKKSFTTPPEALKDLTLLSGSDGKAYVLLETKRRHIVDYPTFLAYGFKVADIKKVTDAELNSYELGEPLTTLIYIPNQPEVYYVVRGYSHWITSGTVFSRLGLNWNKIVPATYDLLFKLGWGDPIRRISLDPFTPTSGKVYLDLECKLSWIPNEDTYRAFGFVWSEVKPYQEKGGKGGCDPVLMRPLTKVVATRGLPQVWFMENGYRRHIATWSAFVRLGLKASDIFYFEDGWLEAYPKGAPIY